MSVLMSTKAQSYKAQIASPPPGGIISTENKSGGMNPQASAIVEAPVVSSAFTGEERAIIRRIMFQSTEADSCVGPNKNSKFKLIPRSLELLYVFAWSNFMYVRDPSLKALLTVANPLDAFCALVEPLFSAAENAPLMSLAALVNSVVPFAKLAAN